MSFLEQLRAAREAASGAPRWSAHETVALMDLLFNNAEKIQRLIEDVGALLLDHNTADDVFWRDVRDSLAALDGEAGAK